MSVVEHFLARSKIEMCQIFPREIGFYGNRDQSLRTGRKAHRFVLLQCNILIREFLASSHSVRRSKCSESPTCLFVCCFFLP